MAKFGKTSLERLSTCHPELQLLFKVVVQICDCTVVCGHRGKQEQDSYYNAVPRRSRVQWPNSKHNKLPSLAVDVAPWVNGAISWRPTHCIFLAGVVVSTAFRLGVKIRWGGNWDMDGEVITDQTFQDLVHYELIVD